MTSGSAGASVVLTCLYAAGSVPAAFDDVASDVSLSVVLAGCFQFLLAPVVLAWEWSGLRRDGIYGLGCAVLKSYVHGPNVTSPT